ncbi:MAG: hypothetical protein NC095_08830 [Muribaculum sp.]|nr:hypothetical protein [Muribaculum sp.]
MKSRCQSILRFVRLTLLAAVPPVAVALIFFILVDPFKALHEYSSSEYFPDPVRFPARISINKGVATLAAFEKNLQKGDTCNSFIFGSSISIYYDFDQWRQKLNNHDDVKAMHFDSSSESIYSLGRKVEYLDTKVKNLNNALIVLDPIIMANEENESPYAIDPPCLHPDDMLFCWRYLYTFFRASTNADFFKNWLPYKIDGKVHNNARNSLFEPQPIKYDSLHNQEYIPDFDKMIQTDPDFYYSRFPLVESPDSISVSEPVLTAGKLAVLHRIASVFKSHNTDYRIIIGPNRRKVTINPADRDSLVAIFGGEAVYDFSESHANELETDSLLYDNSHYRPPFAARLLDLVYQ